MAKKAAAKKAPVKKATPKKKLPPKKKKPIIRYVVARTVNGAIDDEPPFKIGDKVYMVESQNELVTTVRGIYTNGIIIKYHLNTGIYVNGDQIEPYDEE
jgi:hypothetical protein